jgi:hypothetical protein
MKIFALFLFALTGHAGTPPAFDAAKWNALVNRVEQTGKISEGTDEEYRTLENVVPKDPTRARQVDYFSAVGVSNAAGHFTAYHISAVSETWTLSTAGNWSVDQWIWDLALDGNLRGLSHSVITESSAGKILGVQPASTNGPDDPAELSRWGAKLASWLAAQ